MVNEKESKPVKDTRLEFLAKRFNIVDDSTMIDEETDVVNHWLISRDDDNNTSQIRISITAFTNLLITDPSEQKIYLQWLLMRFVKLIEEDEVLARRFIDEDLIATKEYLELFDGNKRKKRFKVWALKGEKRKYLLDPENTEEGWVKLNYNPSDINQYKTIGQLFDAVDPFKIREFSDLEKGMDRFQKMGEGSIEFKDRFWTVFVPYTKAANELFQHVGEWCTAQPTQDMFDTYVVNQKQPNGDNSKIYVLLNNKIFDGESDEAYQIHFESKQIMDRKNQWNSKSVDLYDLVFKEESGKNLREYFHSELDGYAREYTGSVDTNLYIDYLVEFGYPGSLLDYLDKDIKMISFEGKKKIPELPVLDRFQNLRQLIVNETNLTKLHPSVGSLGKIRIMSLMGNRLETLPKEIGQLKTLLSLNLNKNPLKSIPDELGLLDKSKGGKLFNVGVSEDMITPELMARLIELLPSAIINIKDL